MNIEEIKKQAKKELADEEFRDAVNRYKDRLRNHKHRSLWSKLFPFKIIIIRKDKI